LENYTQPVEDDSWDAIEKRLNKKSLRLALWPRISAVAAVAAIALLVLFILPNRDNKINHEEKNALSGYEEPISEDVLMEEIPQPTLPVVNSPEKTHRRSKPVRQYAANNLVSKPDVVNENADQSAAQGESLPPVAEETQAPASEKNQYAPKGHAISDAVFMDDESLTAKKRKKQKSVGLSMGSSSNLLAMNKDALSYTNKYMDESSAHFRSDIALNAAKSIANDLFSTDDFSKIDHYSPLSFGLTLRKELNSVFSLETGLVYTFLQSNFENPVPKREAKLQLHYLGIPLNVNADIYGNQHTKWGVYLSLGGMAEKGLLSHYVQKQYVQDKYVVAISSDEKIDGLQWSVAIAPGIAYKLNSRYSIYLEPKLSYYFDNKQPVSARTEHPVVFGLNAGFRFTW
jgi:hypothetical protein